MCTSARFCAKKILDKTGQFIAGSEVSESVG